MPSTGYYDPLRIEFEKIESVIVDENLLTQGSSFKVYKGQLLVSGELIDIVAREGLRRGLLTSELRITKALKHKNIVSAFMLAAKEVVSKDNDYIIINKYEVNGSLDKHLSSPTLTWIRRLHICVGVAQALNYLHYNAHDNHHVIHGNIKSSKILLDHNWEPKLHGFAFAVAAKKHHLYFTSKYNGALQYMDPAYEETGGLTHKSDVFSFGVLLFEVLFGREASIPNNDNWYFCTIDQITILREKTR